MRSSWIIAVLAALAFLVPIGVHAQLVGGELVVTDAVGARVLQVDPVNGDQVVIGSGGNLVLPTGAAVDPETGLVYVADKDAGTFGAVIEIDPAAYDAGTPAANQRVVSTGGEFTDPTGVVFEKSGQLLVAEGGPSGGVIRVAIVDGAQDRIADIVGATGVVVRAGLIYVSTPNSNEILRIDESQVPTEVLSISSTGFFSTLGGLAVEADGHLLVADFDGEIIRIDPDQIDNLFPDVNQSLVSDDVNLANPRDVAVGLDGTIFVTDSAVADGTVFEVDPVSGAAVSLSTPFGGVGSAIGLALTRRGLEDGDIVVANTGSFASDGRVVQIDPTNGAQTLLAEIPSVKGIAIESATKLVVSAGGGSVTGRVLRLDLATGEVRLVSLQQQLVLAEDLIVATDGTLFVGESSKQTFDAVSMDLVDVGIVEVEPVNGAQTIEAYDDDFRVLALTQEPDTGDFFTASTNNLFDSFTISRVSGGVRTVLATDDLLDTPRGIVVDVDAGLIYVADSSEVLSLPIDGGAQTSISSASIFGSGGLTMDADGMLLVTVGSSFVGRVFRVDPSDGSTAQVSNGGLLKGPRGIAVFEAPEPGVLPGLLVGVAGLGAIARLRRWPRQDEDR
jgi:sugar lactone lactonase YvrE